MIDEEERIQLLKYIEQIKKDGNGSMSKSMDIKSGDFTSGKNGTVKGYFATFDHDKGDSYGDVIRKGAFLGTIQRRKATGHPFPLCFNHDLNKIIGRVIDIGEDYRGAYMEAEFFPTVQAQEVRDYVKSGSVWQFSFMYDVIDQGAVKLADGTIANELRELELYEVSVVTVPANERAVVTEIKNSSTAEKNSNPKRDYLLAYIKNIDRVEKHINTKEQKEALATIKKIKQEEFEKENADFLQELDQVRKMKAQAVKDIKKARSENNVVWLRMRKSALKAIETRESQLASILDGRRKGSGSIKTKDGSLRYRKRNQ